MYDGFKERAARVHALLRDERSGFVVVASPSRLALDEAVYFHGRLAREAGCPSSPSSRTGCTREPRGRPRDAGPPARLRRGPGARVCTRSTGPAAAGARTSARRSRRLEADTREPLLRVPELEADVHDLRGLLEVGEVMLGQEPAPVARKRRAGAREADEDHPVFGQGRRRARRASPPPPPCARPQLGQRTLVVSTDAAHSLADALGSEVGASRRRSRRTSTASRSTSTASWPSHWGVIQEWLTRFMTFQGVDDAVAEEIAILPGMEELFSLLKVKRYAESGRYDVDRHRLRAHRRDRAHAGRARGPELLLQAHLPHPAHGPAVGAAGGEAR